MMVASYEKIRRTTQESDKHLTLIASLAVEINYNLKEVFWIKMKDTKKREKICERKFMNKE